MPPAGQPNYSKHTSRCVVFAPRGSRDTSSTRSSSYVKHCTSWYDRMQLHKHYILVVSHPISSHSIPAIAGDHQHGRTAHRQRSRRQLASTSHAKHSGRCDDAWVAHQRVLVILLVAVQSAHALRSAPWRRGRGRPVMRREAAHSTSLRRKRTVSISIYDYKVKRVYTPLMGLWIILWTRE